MAGAYEIQGFGWSAPASADLSAFQFHAVAINAAGQVVVAGAGTIAVGVLQNKPTAAGQPATIMSSGISKMVAGAALASAGVAVASDADGEAVAAATGNESIGVLLTTAAGGNELVSVLLLPNVFNG